LLVGSVELSGGAIPPESVGERPLPAWQEGELEIHHINTGRGEASFFVLPDGTTLLVDAGNRLPKGASTLPAKPDDSRGPGEWVARYIRSRWRGAGREDLDYAVISHFHDDHMGGVRADTRMSARGGYQLSGITEVAEYVGLGKIIDRGWPDYGRSTLSGGRMMDNYRKFLEWNIAHRGLVVERFRVGHRDQIVLRHAPGKHGGFEIRNLAAGGLLWTGTGTEVRDVRKADGGGSRREPLAENECSIAFRLSYGRFVYFAGGDLISGGAGPLGEDGDVEMAVAKLCGQVDAMKANHHGCSDGNSERCLKLLRPRVIIVDSRAPSHPALDTFHRMLACSTAARPCEVFITNAAPGKGGVAGELWRASGQQGHVVIRVSAGGGDYRVFVLDDADERRGVKAAFGPYPSGNP